MLISIDGLSGTNLRAAAKRVKGGVSTWDSSGIFFELEKLPVTDRPSPRTLLLLYAADLHFRLRWQIEPALKEGQTVVAASYVETAMAFGLCMGLPRKWMTELFQFAPKADTAYWVSKDKGRHSKPHPGFLEFCDGILPADFHVRLAAHFLTLEQKGKCRAL